MADLKSALQARGSSPNDRKMTCTSQLYMGWLELAVLFFDKSQGKASSFAKAAEDKSVVVTIMAELRGGNRRVALKAASMQSNVSSGFRTPLCPLSC